MGDLWLAFMAASGKPPLRGALVAHLKECGSNDGMLERLSHMLCSEIAYAEGKIRSFSGEPFFAFSSRSWLETSKQSSGCCVHMTGSGVWKAHEGFISKFLSAQPLVVC